MYYFIRHSLATHNAKNFFAGNQVNTRLTSEGKQKSQQLFDTKVYRYPIDIIVSSSMTRAFQTAQIFQKNFKKLNKVIPIIKTDLLKEIDIGCLSGLTINQAKTRYPCEFIKGQSEDPKDWNFKNGESLLDLKNRSNQIKQFLIDLNPQNKKNILIVGHAKINKFFFQEILDLDYSFKHDSLYLVDHI